MEDELNIPEIIKQQLYDFSIVMVWSWGAHSFVGNTVEESLSFKVSGHHFTGTVKITLTWEDLYLIQFITPDGNIVKEVDGIYCDQMNVVIDDFVERLPEYND